MSDYDRAVKTYTTQTIEPVDLAEISVDSLQRAAGLIQKRIEQETEAAILGMKVKRCEWMEPDECVMIGNESLVYVKGDKFVPMPINRVFNPTRQPETKIETESPFPWWRFSYR
jgi:hypothetical protein